ncbi:MAG: hypothetical protein J6P38_05490 [Acetobacter sp.]|nr:hypothetical protein [Acetobacter sp.]MBQ3818158.1 hypothetical protein [Acetobacter sp.]MBQ5469576.1 hypothetical protein [Acetobacter sp.]MBQ5516202.1 hypothetical protein [Acetobacter sp.]MBQ5546950.1 hypothetical protein [Acetobacter sp.]
MRYHFLESKPNMKYKILSGVVFVILVSGVGVALGFKGHPPEQQFVHRDFHFELPLTGGSTSQSLTQGASHGDIVPVVPSAPIYPLIHYSDQKSVQQESTSQ